VFTDHLYPAARSYTEGLFRWHMKKIFEFAPNAIQYLEEHHSVPKVIRIRGCLEKNSTKKKVKCHRCRGFGHFAKTCKEPEMGPDGETAAALNKK
jgi:hypothetical protein